MSALAWLRRVARSPAADALVLRGSIVTGVHCPERVAVDVDHLWLVDRFDADAARALVRSILAVPDPTPLGEPTFAIIWGDTPFPGLRATVGELQIDLGWGDPLAAPPVPLTLPGVDAPLAAVTPEVLFGWKTHGLFEFGHGNWLPKDLWDLWLLDRHVALDHAIATEAVRLAFSSRGTSLALADRFLFTTEWGASRGSRQRWRSFSRKKLGTAPLPELADAITAVRARLLPIFAALGHRPRGASDADRLRSDG